jgi:single-stranded-DNA-specific exonuclease
MPDIVGTGFEGRDEIIRKYVKPGLAVYLVRDKNNPYDRNAIAVYIDTPKFLCFGGLKQIGFVDKNRAVKLAERIDSGEKISACVLSMYADMKFPRVTISLKKQEQIK